MNEFTPFSISLPAHATAAFSNAPLSIFTSSICTFKHALLSLKISHFVPRIVTAFTALSSTTTASKNFCAFIVVTHITFFLSLLRASFSFLINNYSISISFSQPIILAFS